MQTTELELLPTEVAQIAQNVPVEKRNEVQQVLNHVFNGVSKMREQLDTIVVEDESDKINMKLANTIRLGVRNLRLESEKTFDAKRAEVQSQMLGFKTEDSLWLKAKQVMQILTKELEETARWKEETKQRYEAEQKELIVQQRMVKLSSFASEIMRSEYENMSEESFDLFFAGIEKKHNDKIEEERKVEAERISREKAEAEERERMRVENEKLKAEREAREKEIEAERAKVEAERKVAEEKSRKEREESEAKLRAEREATAKLEAELKAKKDAEEKSAKEKADKEAAELKAKQLADKKAKSAPDKAKLEALAVSIESLQLPTMSSEETEKILSNTKGLLQKVVTYIRENNLHI
ncbi:hypothetical protein KBA27_07075 [bacterium]|nr:hypothetical protein [bacterium]